jgi:hypothetical protein
MDITHARTARSMTKRPSMEASFHHVSSRPIGHGSPRLIGYNDCNSEEPEGGIADVERCGAN